MHIYIIQINITNQNGQMVRVKQNQLITTQVSKKEKHRKTQYS